MKADKPQANCSKRTERGGGGRGRGAARRRKWETIAQDGEGGGGGGGGSDCVVKQMGEEAHVKDAKRAWERHPSLSEPGSGRRRGGRKVREQGREGVRGAQSEMGTVNAPFWPC